MAVVVLKGSIIVAKDWLQVEMKAARIGITDIACNGEWGR